MENQFYITEKQNIYFRKMITSLYDYWLTLISLSLRVQYSFVYTRRPYKNEKKEGEIRVIKIHR